jgi:hypothetical protein
VEGGGARAAGSSYPLTMLLVEYLLLQLFDQYAERSRVAHPPSYPRSSPDPELLLALQ